MLLVNNHRGAHVFSLLSTKIHLCLWATNNDEFCIFEALPHPNILSVAFFLSLKLLEIVEFQNCSHSLCWVTSIWSSDDANTHSLTFENDQNGCEFFGRVLMIISNKIAQQLFCCRIVAKNLWEFFFAPRFSVYGYIKRLARRHPLHHSCGSIFIQWHYFHLQSHFLARDLCSLLMARSIDMCFANRIDRLRLKLKLNLRSNCVTSEFFLSFFSCTTSGASLNPAKWNVFLKKTLN